VIGVKVAEIGGKKDEKNGNENIAGLAVLSI
jgi:hypothetical protein